MKPKILLGVAPVVAVCLFALASVSTHAAVIPLGRTNYFQDFNSLVSSGKSKTLPAGWVTGQLGTQDSSFVYADDGSLAMSRIYSYGQTGSGNRALGMISDPANQMTFGAEFQNNGSSAINSLHVSFTGEEWRLTAAGRGPSTLQFQYSLNAGSVASGTWLNAPQLNFSTPNLNGVGAHDGTQAANQEQLAGTLSFLNIPVGATFWVRWIEPNLPGGGQTDGLAIDNFSISAVPEASTWFAALAATGFLGVVLWKQRGSRRQSLA